MKDAAPQPVYLADYRPYSHIVDQVDLTFRLSPQATRVLARLHLRPNPASRDHILRLDGEDLRLISARLDGALLDLTPDETGLTIPAAVVPQAPFVLETEVEIAPEGNTALEGLYMSKGMYCTQCEAQGFRKITFYPDRPDVMAPFRVRIESDLPVLLSNGNPAGQGAGGPNGTILGRNPPTSLRWWPAIWWPTATSSPPAPAARWTLRSGCAPAISTLAPMPWTA